MVRRNGACCSPNAIFTVDGLLATPDTVNPPAPPMAPAPAPYVAPPPLPPREILRAGSGGRPAAAPATAPDGSAFGLVDDDRREALAANEQSAAPPPLAGGAAAVLPLAFTVAVLLLGAALC